jgi:(p)ppGpp synthase/HD superfamily hydrolase
MSNKSEKSLLSPKFALALQFANEIHGTQIRKGIGAPYISHLMAVCGLVLEYGGNESQAIAALLHDAAEDCGGRPMLESVRMVFGEDIAEIVDACTDTFDEPKPAWLPRKTSYLAALASEPGSAKLVSCADKFHNISHTLRDIRSEGVVAWKARMEKSKNGSAEKQCWYYLGCLEALSTGWSNPILGEFGRAVTLLCESVGTSADVAKAKSLVGGSL